MAKVTLKITLSFSFLLTQFWVSKYIILKNINDNSTRVVDIVNKLLVDWLDANSNVMVDMIVWPYFPESGWLRPLTWFITREDSVPLVAFVPISL